VPLYAHSSNYGKLQETFFFNINTHFDKFIKKPEQDESGTCPIYFIIKSNKGDERNLQLIQATPKIHHGIVAK
jgi:hypothetical protein